MNPLLIRLGVVMVFPLASAAAQQPPAGQSAGPAGSGGEPVICKPVVAPGGKSRPFEMCMTKSQWAAKEIADARDTDRLVCRYVEDTGSRLSARKICMTSGQWAAEAQMNREATQRVQDSVCVPGAGC